MGWGRRDQFFNKADEVQRLPINHIWGEMGRNVLPTTHFIYAKIRQAQRIHCVQINKHYKKILSTYNSFGKCIHDMQKQFKRKIQ